MLKVSPNNQAVTISGSASEIASLARIIKKSKFGEIKEIETVGVPIKLVCKGKQVEVFRAQGKVVVSYSESTKNELYSLISMPSDTTIGSVFNIRPIDHEQLFAIGSLGLLRISPSA